MEGGLSYVYAHSTSSSLICENLIDWLIDFLLFPVIIPFTSLLTIGEQSNMLDIYIPLLVWGHVSMHFYFVCTYVKHTQIILCYGTHIITNFFHPTLFLRSVHVVFCLDLAHDFWALPDILSCASILLYGSIL